MYCSLPATYYLLRTSCRYSLLTTRYLLLTTHHLGFAEWGMPLLYSLLKDNDRPVRQMALQAQT